MHISRVCVHPAEGGVVNSRWQPCFTDPVQAGMSGSERHLGCYGVKLRNLFQKSSALFHREVIRLGDHVGLRSYVFGNVDVCQKFHLTANG